MASEAANDLTRRQSYKREVRWSRKQIPSPVSLSADVLQETMTASTTQISAYATDQWTDSAFPVNVLIIVIRFAFISAIQE